MSKYGYLVVEGPHDVEFVGRILRPYGFRRIRLKSALDPFWEGLVPEVFPIDDDLLKRVPVPIFFSSDTHSVAVRSAIGDTQIAKALYFNLSTLRPGQLSELVGIGVMLDADTVTTPVNRFAEIKGQIATFPLPLSLPNDAGEIAQGSPKVGVFVLPDNRSQGTLEDVLLECAGIAYPSLLAGADTFVRGVDVNDLTRDDRKEFEKSAGKNKAIVSSISSILKPGKAIQVSIQDNRWLKDDALNLPRVKAVQAFLAELLEFA
jgi:hypothetical protein